MPDSGAGVPALGTTVGKAALVGGAALSDAARGAFAFGGALAHPTTKSAAHVSRIAHGTAADYHRRGLPPQAYGMIRGGAMGLVSS
jgi:hypothetical protein